MNKIIDEEKINNILIQTKNPTKEIIRNILDKAKKKNGLELKEIGYLINFKDAELLQELFSIASNIKEEIYGERLVFFAPLYVSNYCMNDCEYCNFHIRNKILIREKLSIEEIEEQIKFLINMGHKRVLLEFGEDAIDNPIDYVVNVIEKIYSVKTDKGSIHRINVNIAATTVENYKKLKQAKIGTYQLFQETYHRETYRKLHRGPKADYDRQITAHERAFEAGIDDFGIGVLFGLYDWRFEVLSLISHAQYFDKKYDVGPHTISVPRFRNAPEVTYKPEYGVSDDDFLKLIAVLRLAVPYTGMIISTREKPEIRKLAFKVGISQTSAASNASPGGYGKKDENAGHKNAGQFILSDHRPLVEVIEDVLNDYLLPSFCTACYRLNRTGKAFMNFAKDGEIHNFCRPNACLTFAEYLEDFARIEHDSVYKKGYEVINFYLDKIEDENIKKLATEKLNKIKHGERDLFF
ncbi:MAG: [FeFe] hydrogenase H-cluster radical SAM maturase HydG [Elusimicrobiota bacterium]